MGGAIMEKRHLKAYIFARLRFGDKPDPSAPYHLDSRLEDLVAMNLASACLATALAINVLPVPGGPCNKTPLGGVDT
jgi:hypothetical protein